MIETTAMNELAQRREVITVRIQDRPGTYALLVLWPANEDGQATNAWRCVVWSETGPDAFTTPAIDPLQLDRADPTEPPLVAPPLDPTGRPFTGRTQPRQVAELACLSARTGLELEITYTPEGGQPSGRRVRARGIGKPGLLSVDDLTKAGIRSFKISGLTDVRLAHGENRVHRWVDGTGYVMGRR